MTLRAMSGRTIFEIQLPGGNQPVSAFLHNLDDKTRAKIAVQLETLQRRDIPMQPPAVKAFRQVRHKGMFELRTRMNRTMIRIIFCFDDSKIVLLHGFVKKQDRETTYALEMARVRKLALASGEVNITPLIEGGHQ